MASVKPLGVPVPDALADKVRRLPEVRMGVSLAVVILVDGTRVEPVIVNQRPAFLGVARAANLDAWDPPPFTADEIADVADASRFFD